MSYYGFTLQELRDLMELRGEEALVKERGLTLLSQLVIHKPIRKLIYTMLWA